ncbi:hypothetical protein [Pseudomonas sp. S1(2024)]|uniref:hypothetical protein n=1 Tax=Pseudomonas sp. S1(2024) TaxID=3390191 RepID=UPI003978B0CE
MPAEPAANPGDIESRIRELLRGIDPRTVAQNEALPALEVELLRLTKLPAFKQSLLAGNRYSWFALSSLEVAHEMAFLCFCSWGMPLEKVMALLMAMKPASPAPSSWRVSYIKLFASIAAYRWQPASLVMALNQIESKAGISAVSLRIVLKQAYRAKVFVDLVMALRTYLPELNARLELALKGFLSDVDNRQLKIQTLPRELFAPHNLSAGRLGASSCAETRKSLWSTDLSFESRLALGRTDVVWHECSLARQLNWRGVSDLIEHMKQLYEKVGQDQVRQHLAAKSPEMALAKTAFYQSFTSLDQLSNLPVEMAVALFDMGFVRGASVTTGEGRHPQLQHLLLRNSSVIPNQASSAL